MTNEELIWLAGFVDGEGCIMINTKNNKPCSLIIEIVNTNEYIIKLIAKWFKGSVRSVKKGENQKDVWKFCTNGDRAKIFLETIYPYLFLKKEQAYVGLEYQKLVGKKHEQVSSEHLKLRANLYKQICILNKRGKR